MTDQLQPTRDQRTPPAGTEPTDQDRTGLPSSTQDSTVQDSTDADRPADDGTVYRSAGYDTAVDQPDVLEPDVLEPDVLEPDVLEPDVHESVADGTANQRGADQYTEHPAGDGLEPVDGSVPAGLADPDPDPADPDRAVGVASVPDADPEADTVDRGAFDAAEVAANDDVRTDAPDETYSHRADTPAAMQEVEVADAASSDVARADDPLPGDLPEEPGLALFDSETTQRFRDRWHELQLRFVDDPHFAEGQAVALVDEVVTALRDAVDRQRAALHDWQAGQGADAATGETERMRVAVRRYRDFLDHLLGV
jgi:hypothetical protein